MLFLMMQSDWPSVLYILDTTLLQRFSYVNGKPENKIIYLVVLGPVYAPTHHASSFTRVESTHSNPISRATFHGQGDLQDPWNTKDTGVFISHVFPDLWNCS
jgi:hypothetical protein